MSRTPRPAVGRLKAAITDWTVTSFRRERRSSTEKLSGSAVAMLGDERCPGDASASRAGMKRAERSPLYHLWRVGGHRAHSGSLVRRGLCSLRWVSAHHCGGNDDLRGGSDSPSAARSRPSTLPAGSCQGFHARTPRARDEKRIREYPRPSTAGTLCAVVRWPVSATHGRENVGVGSVTCVGRFRASELGRGEPSRPCAMGWKTSADRVEGGGVEMVRATGPNPRRPIAEMGAETRLLDRVRLRGIRQPPFGCRLPRGVA